MRGMVSCISAPLMASQKLTLTWYSRSVPRSGALHRLAAPGPAEDVGEDVAEATAAGATSGCSCAFSIVVEIEAAEIEGHFLRIGVSPACALAWSRAAESPRAKSAAARVSFGRGGIDVVGVEAELVVDLALLRIAEDVVGLGDLLELLLGRLVPGIHVGVIFARKFTERLADIIRGRRLLDPEQAVIIFVFVVGCSHVLASGRQL